MDASPFDYTNWGPGQPNGGDKENCLFMHPDKNRTWIDVACSASYHGATICSRDSGKKEKVEVNLYNNANSRVFLLSQG